MHYYKNMETITTLIQEILNSLLNSVDVSIMALVLAIGEGGKRLGKKIIEKYNFTKEWFVFLITIPFVIVYAILQKLGIATVLLSYSLIFFLYPFLIEKIINFFIKKEEN